MADGMKHHDPKIARELASKPQPGHRVLFVHAPPAYSGIRVLPVFYCECGDQVDFRDDLESAYLIHIASVESNPPQ